MILLTNQISLSDSLYFLSKVCIVIIYFSVHDVKDFETSLSFLIKPFFYKTEKVRINPKKLERKKSFNEIKSFLRQRAFIEANKTNFLGSRESNFMASCARE